MSVVAFLLVLILGTVVAGRSGVGTAKVTVVVAAADINNRDLIVQGDLTTAALPATAVPPSAVLAYSAAVGKVAQVNILKGQTVTTNLFADQGTGNPAYLPIPQGWLAATIPASEQQAVAGYVSPGDVIDIEATVSGSVFNASVQNAPQVTRTVFSSVHVIKVGPATAQGVKGGSVQGVTSSLTILVTPCDAPYLTWLVSNGNVRYTLKSSKDYGGPPTAASPSCPLGSAQPRVGPAEIDSRWSFSKG
jgi:pilus assembly protein CpaB